VSRYRAGIDAVRAHNRSLWVVIALLVAIIAAQFVATSQIPREIRLRYPPELRSGAVLGLDEVPPSNVYAFAHYIFQQLNRWPEDGARDYDARLFKLSAYLTPRFRAELEGDIARREHRGELAGRTRGVQELAGHGYEERRVDVLSDGAWVVWLDLSVEESVGGVAVKETAVRYPLRVVLYDVDPEANPWGLALDGYAAAGPRRLTEDELGAPGV
jgi:integrating conjugative element protein (TIGR03746 family)